MKLARAAHIATPPQIVHSRVVAFVSGLGGAGTSTIARGVAETLSSGGERVVLVSDADGMVARWGHARDGTSSVWTREVGASPDLDQLRGSHDAVIVDCPPGLSAPLLRVVERVDDLVLVLTPAPADLVQTYALLKRIAPQLGLARVGLIVNRASSGQAASAARRFSNCARRFLGLAPMLHGRLPLHGRARHAEPALAGGGPRVASIAASVCLSEISARLCPAMFECPPPRRLWLQFASLFL
ncbi:MAG: hypothetical protein CHACPFDD_01003 [Phycisphaerae bacterium]|nr:hypothetical protein [Phycisphaerae bacterium]